MLLPLSMLAGEASHGQDSQAAWRALDLHDWRGKSASGNGFDLERGTADHNLPLESVEGKWIRVTASAKADAHDFKILVSVFNAQSRVISRNLPTRCEVAGHRKVCTAAAWVQPGGAYAKLTLYSNFLPVTAVPERAEVAIEQQLLQSNKARFDSITSDIARLYFRTAEVDWPLAKSKVDMALAAPGDIDPVPYAILQLLGHLPDSKHSFVYSTDEPGSSAVVRPSCKRLQTRGASSVWRLDLPGTPSGEPAKAMYIRAATDCLRRRGVGRWVINLTENAGGDALVMFAALSPLLKVGALMEFQNASGGRFVVAKSARGILYDGKLTRRVGLERRSFRSTALVAIGAGCASSCEAVVIAMKGKYRLVGTPTAGFATANETVSLSKSFSLAITSGHMADARGKVYGVVEPDTAANDEEIARILQSGMTELE